jgi:hypothetical protein
MVRCGFSGADHDGAGFIGSDLCERLITEGWNVVCVDSLLTARDENLQELSRPERFEYMSQYVTEPFVVEGGLDRLLHLASPASPVEYPLWSIRPGRSKRAESAPRAPWTRWSWRGRRRSPSSSPLPSEMYGDLLVHPQSEKY